MNRIVSKLKENKKILSLYFTAGYPNLADTLPTLKQMEAADVDLVEIGLPFSDPLADGPTIQNSSTQALNNGMTTQKLFEQLAGVREHINMPLIIMGYFNPVLQYGVDAFCAQCAQIGIDGLILPDLPLEEYQEHYQPIFEKYGLANIFLITPQTSDARIRQIDAASNAFIYMVSTASVTGSKSGFGPEQTTYFKRVSDMGLKNPLIVGFGIKDQETFDTATEYTQGAIIGSACIKHLTENGPQGIDTFVKSVRP
ncbi:tryptophan synthase subunit alpha [Sediminicola luteus]|uniref:Tryptophan synthase alpha chain n=1 Tax=Sediminicola luteus TaxID=319238 RepID=A0A2A4G5A2_9FLAO|nr:tryptophan synthase subunit alpha [Sediminicola luteus]PCE63613.1 tryptophan synthase subunit alpha [Sediminicola luteus]